MDPRTMVRADDENDPESLRERVVALITWDRIFAVLTVAAMVVLMAALGWWLSIDLYGPAWQELTDEIFPLLE